MDCIFKGGCDAVCGRTHWMPAALAVSFPCVRRVCVLLTCCTWKQSQRKHLTTWNVWDMSKVRPWKRATTTSPSKKIVSLPFQFAAPYSKRTSHTGASTSARHLSARRLLALRFISITDDLFIGFLIIARNHGHEQCPHRNESPRLLMRFKKKKKVLNTDLLIIH